MDKEILSEGFNFAEVDVDPGMMVKIRGERRRLPTASKVVVVDNKEAYGGSAKTIAAMAGETVARVTHDAQQAQRAYDQALEQAEESPEERWLLQRIKAWQVKNRIEDIKLEYDPAREVWYMRYLVINKSTGLGRFRYRQIADSALQNLGEFLRQKEAE